MDSVVTPRDRLDAALDAALEAGTASMIDDPAIRARIDYVARCIGNRAGVRTLPSRKVERRTHRRTLLSSLLRFVED